MTAGINKSPVEVDRLRVCAVVVTYHPDEELEQRLAPLFDQVGALVIVDNTADGAVQARLRALAGRRKVRLILNAENRGLAAGLNQGVAWAKRHGFAWCLLLDQDSTPVHDIVDVQLRPFLDAPEDRPLAVVGSSFTAPGLPTDRGQDQGGGRDPLVGLHSYSWRELPAVITSGSLVSLDAYDAIGPFREEFFVDAVDIDFCLRARAKGYRVLETRPPVIAHRVGNIRRHRLLWREAWVTHHPAWRRYLMLRNCTALLRTYAATEPEWARAMIRYMISFSLRIVLFEDRKVKKLWSELRGLVDGLSGNFDRIVPND